MHLLGVSKALTQSIHSLLPEAQGQRTLPFKKEKHAGIGLKYMNYIAALLATAPKGWQVVLSVDWLDIVQPLQSLSLRSAPIDHISLHVVRF